MCVYVLFKIPVEGAAPEARHSHSACSYQGGVVVFGGVDRRGVPLGDTVVLRPNERGFSWERIEVQPSPVPRSVVFQSSDKLSHHSVHQNQPLRPCPQVSTTNH